MKPFSHDHCMVCGADFGTAVWQCKVDIGGDHGETEEYSKDWKVRCEKAEAMLDQARADANYFDNLTKMKLQSLIQQEPEGVDAASDVFDRVIDCFRRLKRERDAAVAALTEEQQRGSNTCLEWSDGLTETLQCLADACPLGWIAAQDMNEAQAWEKRAAALILKHGTKEVP